MRLAGAQTFGLAGVAMLVFGAALPWASGSFTLYNGLDPRGVGPSLLVIPFATALGLLVGSRLGAFLTLLVGAAGVGVAALQAVSITNEIERAGPGSVQPGLYVFGLGASVVVAAAVWRISHAGQGMEDTMPNVS